MFRQKLTVSFPEGLHVGPAYQLAKLAKGWPCRVNLLTTRGCYNAKSGFAVLQAGIGPGGTLELVCEGEREAEAGWSLVAFLTGSDLTQQ